MILYILLGIIVLFIIAAVAGTRDSNIKGKEAARRLLKMEEKYQDFVETYIAGHVLDENDLDVNAALLSKDAMIVIQPDLKGILSLVNSTIYSTVTVQAEVNYFPNLIGLTEAYFVSSQKNKTKVLTEAEEHNYMEAAREAIEADIKKRLIDLKLQS